ncbi:MAG: carbohydrate-binding domain-containing protein [Lachnospiraceae bacterium]|nr:carbohydrate-binding domain-containing protein [Lachnospiraceae bacterium]
MKKNMKIVIVCLCIMGMLAGCKESGYSQVGSGVLKEEAKPKVFEGVTEIALSDEGITVDGEAVSEDASAPVYVAKDIVFYLAGQGFTYGEGEEKDEHTQSEADKHTVVHITKPGTYAVTGTLSAGQIAVDLGKDAKEDPQAVVTLIMNNAEITCSVAPAVIFYNVYECSGDDKDNPTKDVDTSAAGANVLIADGTYNTVNGSYVARIYKSYELSEDGTEVVDSKKLHKYDAAFYSKMSMNVNGDEEGTGVLEINAKNEGLDSELHLTINGGNIKITSGNDGINTNEDGVSVTTVNGGTLEIAVDGSTGEGDGIDSNGWLVINGGTVVSYACGFSGDAGIDSDMGIHINGGTVVATGNMLDRIGESQQNYAVFSFSSGQNGGKDIILKDADDKEVGKWATVNDYSYLIVSGDFLKEGTYTLWIDGEQYAGASGNQGRGFGGGMGGMNFGGKDGDFKLEEGQRPMMPEGMTPGEMPEGEMPEIPEGMTPGEMPEMPEEMMPGEMPEIPEGAQAGRGGFGGRGPMNQATGELSKEFTITAGGNYFNGVSGTM